MSLSPGTRLGTYEIVTPLGAGGMGEVYRARDLRLGRDVALKVLPADVAARPEQLARLEREARTVAGLNHPNIITLFSIEDEDGLRFLTMELVEGQSLAEHVVPGGLPVARVLEIGIALADALAAAHEQGVVHRDLKPANVMLSREGRVKVLDFGLARVAAGVDAAQAATLTSVGEVMGTAAYMAPEQIRGDAVDARTDLFALGILLYELVTGRRPFGGATAADISSATLRDAPPPAQALRADLPPDVARILERCLEKDPERRVQTAKDVRNELERVRRALESGVLKARQAEPPSIAVLPFVNRGRDEDDEYFADGITEDVIAQLCKVHTLKVISRSSVMPFRNRDESVQEIAARLGVRSVLEGSVRRVGDRVRIVAQLIDVASGRHLWAETYDRQLTDIFAIQSEVALHIAGALQAELSPDERKRIGREPTQDLQAYELYLRGRQCLVRFTVEGAHESIGYFERALERDPGFALAQVGIALAFTELVEYGVMGREQAGPRAREAAARAVALDPELGAAHYTQAFTRLVFDYDWARAEAGFRRALELSPGSAEAHDLYGRMCAGIGRFDEAIALQRRGVELDPLTLRSDLANTLLRAGRNEEATREAERAIRLEPRDARLHATLGWALFRQGRVDEGLAALDRAVTLSPTENGWLAQRGQALAMAGRTDEAHEVLRRLQDPSRPTPVSPYHLAYVYTGLSDAERAMDCLERAHELGVGSVYGMKGSFLLAPLRQHPRFAALLEKVGQG